MITVTLSGEPRGKGRPRFHRATGRVFTPADTAKYESALRYAAQEAMAERAPFEGPLKVRVVAVFPIPASWPKWRKERALLEIEHHASKPDWENVAKMLDAFNGVVWRDDKQVAIGFIEKIYGTKPSLTITVEPLAVAERVLTRKRASTEPCLSLPLTEAS